MHLLTVKFACSVNAVRLPLNLWSSFEQVGNTLILATGCMLSQDERYLSRQLYVGNELAEIELLKESRVV